MITDRFTIPTNVTDDYAGGCGGEQLLAGPGGPGGPRRRGPRHTGTEHSRGQIH